ncbi:MAG: ACT domain-containing protein [Caldilineae bacterium]|nr:MAG: ACT domain-containing protein [Caldilineae bacterium]
MKAMKSLTLCILEEPYVVCRLPADAPLPTWAADSPFLSITRTGDELSLVCAERYMVPGVQAERGWRVLQVAGPLDFGLIGVIARLADTLAAAKVSVFVISTYDTDYILVKEDRLTDAVRALEGAGHRVKEETGGLGE